MLRWEYVINKLLISQTYVLYSFRVRFERLPLILIRFQAHSSVLDIYFIRQHTLARQGLAGF